MNSKKEKKKHVAKRKAQRVREMEKGRKGWIQQKTSDTEMANWKRKRDRESG